MSWHKWGAEVAEEMKNAPGTGHPSDRDAAHQISSNRWRHHLWGFDLKLADGCEDGELIQAALAYLCYPNEGLWPFDSDGFFPGDPEDNLVWAATYLAAEADRIARARLAGKAVSSGLVVLAPPPERLERCVDGLREVSEQMQEIRHDLSA